MPAFAVHNRNQIGLFALVFSLMTGLLCLLAHWLVHHPDLGRPIRRYGHLFAPIFLIGIGVLIMFESGSLGLLFRVKM